MRTEKYNVTTGHVYHVYCALGGNVYKAKDAVAATASVTPLESYAAETECSLGIGDGSNTYGGFTWTPGEAATPADFVDALNTLGNWGTGPEQPMETPLVHAVLDEDSGKVVLTIVDENWIGTDGNRLKVTGTVGTLPISDEVPVSFSGGADAQRVLVGELDSFDCVRYVPASGWPRIEVDVADEAWVQVRDKDSAWVAEKAPTEPGQYYNVYADDDVRILYRNTELLALPGFGGTGGFQAPGMEVTVKRKVDAEVSIMDCAAGDCLSTVHLTYPVISDLT